jgi:hypothetical protein
MFVHILAICLACAPLPGRATLDDAREALNRFMSEDVAAFGSATEKTGIGLFTPVPPLSRILHEGG